MQPKLPFAFRKQHAFESFISEDYDDILFSDSKEPRGGESTARVGGMGGFMGGVYGKACQNIAGLGTERGYKPNFDPGEILQDTILGGILAPLPVGNKLAEMMTPELGSAKNFIPYWLAESSGFTTKSGALRAIFNPLAASGRYFYASTIFDTMFGFIAYEGLKQLESFAS